MKAVGIIAEYNPLHNGHIYNINEAKRLSGADFVVACISGDFVQRGEPAILDKWTRAKLAINAGVDVVFEIPTYFALSDASGFASCGVRMIKGFGMVTDIAFGSECGDIAKLAMQTRELENNKNEIYNRIKAIVKVEGCSFPAARAKAFKEICGHDMLSGSNDILASEYIRNIDWLNPIAVKRKGNSYNNIDLVSGEFASATAIRKALSAGKSVNEYVPDYTLTELEGLDDNMFKEFSDRLFELIIYRIITASCDEIDSCPAGGEGLSNRLKSSAYKAKNLRQLIENTKSKRYTYTRISRLLMQLLLCINRNYFNEVEPAYLRVLAASKSGRKLISECEKHEMNSIPIITNINKNIENAAEFLANEKKIEAMDKLLDLDCRASCIYNLLRADNLYSGSDNVIFPYME